MNIILGSTSKHKLEALKKACELLKLEANISGIKTESGQNEQPVGFEETFQGALTRAQAAQTHAPTNFAVGIESGIFNFNVDKPTTLDIATIIILTPDGKRIVASSMGVQFPEEFVKIAEQRGFTKNTVGSVIAAKLGGDATDPHSTLTHGKITRSATLVGALVTALSQL